MLLGANCGSLIAKRAAGEIPLNPDSARLTAEAPLLRGEEMRKDKKIPTEEYKNPMKNISQGFLSALNGFINDSSTIG